MKSAVYESFFRHMSKVAEEQGPEEMEYLKRFGRVLRPMLTGAAGFGLGQLAGSGLGKALERVDHKAAVPGARAARIIGPTAGAAAGLAHALYKQREQKEVQDAVLGKQNKTR